MKITAQRLKTLTKSPDYHALPFSLAGAGEADSTWWQTLEQVGEEARFMHQGMTSSDVLDTCLAVQLARASDILLADMDALLERQGDVTIPRR